MRLTTFWRWREMVRLHLNIATRVYCPSEWKLIPVTASMMDIVARVTGRLFIGLPLCKYTPVSGIQHVFSVGHVRQRPRIYSIHYQTHHRRGNLSNLDYPVSQNA